LWLGPQLLEQLSLEPLWPEQLWLELQLLDQRWDLLHCMGL
jgi:hypothetical protein